MANRILWPVIFLLGLVIGLTNGQNQMAVGRARVLVEAAVAQQSAPAEEAVHGLELSFRLTTVSLYLGLAVCVLAIVGSALPTPRAPSGDP